MRLIDGNVILKFKLPHFGLGQSLKWHPILWQLKHRPSSTHLQSFTLVCSLLNQPSWSSRFSFDMPSKVFGLLIFQGLMLSVPFPFMTSLLILKLNFHWQGFSIVTHIENNEGQPFWNLCLAWTRNPLTKNTISKFPVFFYVQCTLMKAFTYK